MNLSEEEQAWAAPLALFLYGDAPKPKTPKHIESVSNPDEQIYSDLQTCIDARALIPREQDKIRLLIDAATTEIERQARWYQFELVAAQLERAYQVAVARLRNLESLKSADDFERERERCKNGPDVTGAITGPAGGTIYWFQMYAWGYDPREDSPIQVMPFYLFRFQEEYIKWIERLVFQQRASGLGEKARDMGATVCAILWADKQFLFRPGFSAFFTSATEDLVDSKRDPDTLFEKARFQFRRTPTWMLPRGFDLLRDMPYQNISNPENGANITGGAPTANVGRQRRRTFVLVDEAAALPYGGYPQHTALSQTTRSMLKISSVQGMFNQFADERHSGRANVFVMNWSDHPWKDDRWYNALPYGYLGAPMSPEAIAQEIDRNYKASQPGRILPMWDEVLSVITWEEFERVYGKTHIPTNWNLARLQDVGTTEDHLNCTSWYSKPRKVDPFNDTIFAYREFVAPTDWPVEWIGEGRRNEEGDVIEDGMQQFETPLKESERMTVSLISQEGESEQRTYQKTCKRYPIRFSRIKKPEANGGISQMRALMTPLPEPNPFIIDPRTEDPNHESFVLEHNCDVCKRTHAGAHLIGRPRYIVIVNKDEGELRWDGERLYRLAAKTNLGGQKEARREYPLYHYPVSERDKPVAARKPFKRDDDRIDNDRYLCRVWGPPAADKSPQEDFEDQLPENLRQENLKPRLDEHGNLQMTRSEQEDLAQKQLSRNVYIALKGVKEKPKKAVHYRKKGRK
ncbi:MAG: hypothetical protein WBV94_21825 [Blastocatellia bacterium]